MQCSDRDPLGTLASWRWRGRLLRTSHGDPVVSPCAVYPRRHARWIVGAGAAAGGGIWATHFIATLAYDPGIAITYDLTLTIGSLLIAVALTVAGLAAASSAASLAAPVGGAIIGAGLAATHYTGMASLELSGQIIWSAGLIVASIVAGLVFAAAAMGVAVRGRGLRNTPGAALRSRWRCCCIISSA